MLLENPNQESPGVKVPKQATARADEARRRLTPPVPATDIAPPATDGTATHPAPVAFTVDELLQAPSPEKDASLSYWKSRANAIEGFRRADVKRLEAVIADSSGRIGALEAQLAASAKANPTVEALPEVDVRNFYSDAMLEKIGPENAKEILQATLKSVQPLIQQQIEAATKPLIEATAKKTASEKEAAQVSFVEALTAGCPNWAEIDAMPTWRQWLEGVEPASGLTRQEIVNRHKARNNAAGIVKLLDEFVATLNPAPTPPKPNVTVTGSLGSGNEAPEAPKSDGPPLTDADLRTFYKDAAIPGKLSAEYKANFEARIKRERGRM